MLGRVVSDELLVFLYESGNGSITPVVEKPTMKITATTHEGISTPGNGNQPQLREFQ